ncbi:hypothetical protein JHK86_043114 [Glycine max]|nr:hypothetical protein JHK86_043114 [Glycine max]
MEVDLPLGWKPLNLEHCDGTTNLDEHLDVFLTQTNLYTNDNAILCRVFPTSLKGPNSGSLNHSCAQPEKDGSTNHALSQRRKAQPIRRHLA